jgi:hypothetical protein
VGDKVTIHFHFLGVFTHASMGHFQPELPFGIFQAESITGPYKARDHDATVILNYLTPVSGVLYVDTVTIQKAPCPKVKKKPKLE